MAGLTMTVRGARPVVGPTVRVVLGVVRASRVVAVVLGVVHANPVVAVVLRIVPGSMAMLAVLAVVRGSSAVLVVPGVVRGRPAVLVVQAVVGDLLLRGFLAVADGLCPVRGVRTVAAGTVGSLLAIVARSTSVRGVESATGLLGLRERADRAHRAPGCPEPGHAPADSRRTGASVVPIAARAYLLPSALIDCSRRVVGLPPQHEGPMTENVPGKNLKRVLEVPEHIEVKRVVRRGHKAFRAFRVCRIQSATGAPAPHSASSLVAVALPSPHLRCDECDIAPTTGG